VQIDLQKTRREQIRWIVLLALNHARPYGCYESVVLATIQGVYPDGTALELRRELDYLADRRLVELRKEPSGSWWADVTRHGTDIVEYTTDCQPGIARPAKYW
jgi:hypothetical protein